MDSHLPNPSAEAAIVAAIYRRNRAWSEALDARKRAGEALERAADAMYDEHMARLRHRASWGERKMSQVAAREQREAADLLERAANALTVASEADREVRRLLTEAGR